MTRRSNGEPAQWRLSASARGVVEAVLRVVHARPFGREVVARTLKAQHTLQPVVEARLAKVVLRGVYASYSLLQGISKRSRSDLVQRVVIALSLPLFQLGQAAAQFPLRQHQRRYPLLGLQGHLLDVQQPLGDVGGGRVDLGVVTRSQAAAQEVQRGAHARND